MPGCVIILPKTAPPKMVSGRLDLSFGIFARRGEKYSCYGSMNRQKYPNRHSRAGGNPDRSARKLIGKKGFSGPESWIPTFVGMTAVDLADAADSAGLNPSYNPPCPPFTNPPPSRKTQKNAVRKPFRRHFRGQISKRLRASLSVSCRTSGRTGFGRAV